MLPAFVNGRSAGYLASDIVSMPECSTSDACELACSMLIRSVLEYKLKTLNVRLEEGHVSPCWRRLDNSTQRQIHHSRIQWDHLLMKVCSRVQLYLERAGAYRSFLYRCGGSSGIYRYIQIICRTLYQMQRVHLIDQVGTRKDKFNIICEYKNIHWVDRKGPTTDPWGAPRHQMKTSIEPAVLEEAMDPTNKIQKLSITREILISSLKSPFRAR